MWNSRHFYRDIIVLNVKEVILKYIYKVYEPWKQTTKNFLNNLSFKNSNIRKMSIRIKYSLSAVLKDFTLEYFFPRKVTFWRTFWLVKTHRWKLMKEQTNLKTKIEKRKVQPKYIKWRKKGTIFKTKSDERKKHNSENGWQKQHRNRHKKERKKET